MCLIIALFIALATLIEVKLLSAIGDQLGTGNMWLLLIGSAFIGWRLLSEQKQMNQKIQMQMMRGELSDPSQVMRPLVALLSGILLIIPGPITDLLGLAMLHPVIGQRILQSLFKGGLQAAMKKAQGGSAGGPFGGAGSPFGAAGGPFGGAGSPFGGANGPFGGTGGPFGTVSSDMSAEDQSEIEATVTRDGVHPTQRPKGNAHKNGRTRSSSHRQGSVDPQQVIIDVDAEIIDK